MHLTRSSPTYSTYTFLRLKETTFLICDKTSTSVKIQMYLNKRLPTIIQCVFVCDRFKKKKWHCGGAK